MPSSQFPPTGLRVVHLGTFDQSGGAAIAAWRLHRGLLAAGAESRVVCRTRSGTEPEVSCIDSAVFAPADLFNLKTVRRAQPPDASTFTLAATTLPLLDHPWIAAADVIHLHWVARFLSPEDVEALCLAGKTVFWSLHDQWPYTGGCHYIGGGRREEQDWDGTAQIGAEMHALARLERSRKLRHLSTQPIHVIAPSRWMAREAAASGVFPAERIHVVPYGFDLSVFSATGRPDTDTITLAFGCHSLGDRRKGLPELLAALKIAMEDPHFAGLVRSGKIRLQTFGRLPAEEIDPPIPASHAGPLDERGVAGVLRGATAFLCPTLEDNLPSVVIEALACGCPVIGFATGGVPDMVAADKNGLLAPRGDVGALARLLVAFCLDAGLRQRLADGVRATDFTPWSLATQADRMLELYRAATPHPQAGPMPEAPPRVQLDGRILPHFATEIAIGLAAHCASLEAARRGTLRHSQKQSAKAGRRLAKLEAKLTATRQKLEKTREKLTHLKTLPPPPAPRKPALLARLRQIFRGQG